MRKAGLPLLTTAIALVTALAFICPVRASYAASAPASLRQLGDAFAEIAEKVTPAVVNIQSTKKIKTMGKQDLGPMFKDHPLEEFFKHFGPKGKHFKREGMGSGVIVSKDGLILTNAHVVRDADEIKVKLSDKRSFEAKVVGADKESDIAVIKIEADNLPVAKLGDSSKLRVGEIVLAIGNPFGLNKTVTSGIVSATGRTNIGIIDYEDFIQTDAAINPGNSGGPLVNIEGEVIGINTAIATRSGGYQGIGFAIPSNTADHIKTALVKEGKVRRGFLGVKIQNLTDSLAKSFGREDTKGALVSEVIAGSAAEAAGVKAGDIILEFNGREVDNINQLRNMVGRLLPGTKAEFVVWRNGEKLKLDATVKERPSSDELAGAEDEPEAETGKARKSEELGIEVGEVPTKLAEKLNLDKGGVVVEDVDEDGLGRKMGLRKGDVILEANDTTVKSVDDLQKAVEKAKKDKVIRLMVQRGDSKIFLAESF